MENDYTFNFHASQVVANIKKIAEKLAAAVKIITWKQ